MLAIIGGSGLAKLPILEITHRQMVRTPFGDTSGALTFGRIGQQNVVFIARHGYGHSLAPHEINYRANIWALHNQAVSGIISIASVGGIRPDMGPGALVLPDNIIDYTWGRKHTFFEGPERPVVHVDFTEPYDQVLRQRLLSAAHSANVAVIPHGVYACAQGPRLETATEITRFERDGADLIGMTGMPEASLARELNMPYAHLCLVVNWAAGKGRSATVSFDSAMAEAGMNNVTAILLKLLSD